MTQLNRPVSMTSVLEPGRVVFSVKDVSSIARVSEKYVRRLVDRGILKKTGEGLRLVLITRASVEKWLGLVDQVDN